MCDPTGIAIGAAIGAATSAATGGDPLQGAVLGGVTGGFFPGSVGVENVLGPTLTGAPLAPVISASGVATAAGIGLVGGSIINPILNPPTFDLPQQTAGIQQLNQQFNTIPTQVSGSGGKQAAASLAEAVRRSKQRKLTQEDVSDLSIDTSSFAPVGLQLA